MFIVQLCSFLPKWNLVSVSVDIDKIYVAIYGKNNTEWAYYLEYCHGQNKSPSYMNEIFPHPLITFYKVHLILLYQSFIPLDEFWETDPDHIILLLPSHTLSFHETYSIPNPPKVFHCSNPISKVSIPDFHVCQIKLRPSSSFRKISFPAANMCIQINCRLPKYSGRAGWG